MFNDSDDTQPVTRYDVLKLIATAPVNSEFGAYVTTLDASDSMLERNHWTIKISYRGKKHSDICKEES